MKLRLSAKSSSGSSYIVDFERNGTELLVSCECKAGTMGKACKHRLALLEGDATMLADPTQADQLKTVVQWASECGYSELLQDLKNAEAEMERAKRRAGSIRKELTAGMSGKGH